MVSRGQLCSMGKPVHQPLPLTCAYPSLSHCADAVLSLANTSTVVANVSSTVAELIAGWAQTRAGYDLLFARVVWSDWATRHRPVLSTGRDTHTLYTGVTLTEPDGLTTKCHQGCGVENQVVDVEGGKVEIVCNGCGSFTRFKRAKPKTSSVLDRVSLLKTTYPQGPAPVEWKIRTQTTPGHAPMEAKPQPIQGLVAIPARQVPPVPLAPQTSTATAKRIRAAPTESTLPPQPQLLRTSPHLTRSTSLPVTKTTKPDTSIPSPTVATVSPIAPPTIPPGPPQPSQQRQRTRADPTTLHPPAMVRAHSAPQMTGKRQDRPALDLPTPVPKRQRKRG